MMSAIWKHNPWENLWSNQRGALFGMDARISLAIFGAMAIVAGAYTANNIYATKAQGFSKELSEVTEAIEAIHNDLGEDLHSSLESVSDENAYVALYDNVRIKPGRLRGRWLGPYLQTATSTHKNFGEIRVTKAGEEAKKDCVAGHICYLWITYDNVPMGVLESLNKTFDGHDEVGAEAMGRVQWHDGYEDNRYVLWFRATRALKGTTSFY